MKTANWTGNSTHLLFALGILSAENKPTRDSARKLKQVNHLIQFILPDLDEIYQKSGSARIADLGAGKAYLGLILYDAWLKNRNNTEIWCIESRPELCLRAEKIARESGFQHARFICNTITLSQQDDAIPGTIDLVTALHACDTATDEAIAFALAKNASTIALVPCCQAEAAQWLAGFKPKSADALLWRQGIHRREFGSLLTNTIRTLFLESRGYKVTVTELTGWEHSLKNELIIARRIQKTNVQAQRKLEKLLNLYPVPLKLLSLA